MISLRLVGAGALTGVLALFIANLILAATTFWSRWRQARDIRKSNNVMAALAHLAGEQRYHVGMSRDGAVMA